VIASGFRAAVSPDCTYRLISAALQEAKKTLLVYVYEIHADYMVELVKQAHARGAKVRLMYDRGGTHAEERDVLEALAKPHFEIKTSPSSGGRGVFTVCHQKFVVIDGKEGKPYREIASSNISFAPTGARYAYYARPKAGGKWNTYEITAKGPQLTVVLNGTQTANAQDSQFAQGPFALQFGNGPNDAPGGVIKWRKVQIRPL